MFYQKTLSLRLFSLYFYKYWQIIGNFVLKKYDVIQISNISRLVFILLQGGDVNVY